jgi:hypothetical protein
MPRFSENYFETDPCYTDVPERERHACLRDRYAKANKKGHGPAWRYAAITLADYECQVFGDETQCKFRDDLIRGQKDSEKRLRELRKDEKLRAKEREKVEALLSLFGKSSR